MPSKSTVYVVTGFGRCGSTLTMRMLQAGGMPVIGQPPAFESMRTAALGYDADWVLQQRGHAVKVLYHRGLEFLPGDWRFIWLKRNYKQQARSFKKFHEATDNNRQILTRRDVSCLVRDFRCDEPIALSHMRRRGPVYILRYEEIKRTPLFAAAKLIEWCELGGASARTMAAQVVNRETRCMPDLSVEEGLE